MIGEESLIWIRFLFPPCSFSWLLWSAHIFVSGFLSLSNKHMHCALKPNVKHSYSF